MRDVSSPPRGLDTLAPSLGATCGDYLTRYREGLAERLQGGEPGVSVARALAQVLDGLLSALFCAADAAAREEAPRPRVALVAVGGYGRGTLGLASDVDLLFLTDDPSDRYPGALANGMLYPLWDLGVDLGHVVRGVGETLKLAREDVRTATTLVDARRIAGDESICEELERGASRDVFQPALTAFLDALGEDTAARHERFGGSLYLLEPEVKLGRGGLRDLDVAEWTARARWGARCPADCVRTGALLRREVEELEAAREMLWRVRQHLHLRAGRKQDRLTFADQEEIATELGFVDGITLGVEQFMQAYYRHARVVAQTAERMLERARPVARRSRPPARDLGDGTSLFGDAVTLTSTERLAKDPALAFRLYDQVKRRELRPYGYARDAIARAAVDPELRERMRGSEEATRLFLALLAGSGVPVLPRRSVVTELHEVGLLVAMVPELEPLVGRVVHDVYNVYTVDVHALRAVDRFREVRAGDHARDMPLASRLAAETPRRVPIVLALLLHGLGRVHGGNDRRRGATAAEAVARRLGLDRRDAEPAGVEAKANNSFRLSKPSASLSSRPQESSLQELHCFRSIPSRKV
ncbi:MAG: nucleotidyltransferase domain-containing protein [Myxococcota bacterium]